ncbi:MAG: hypothetical protein VB835_07590 [Pirellulales bacterium]
MKVGDFSHGVEEVIPGGKKKSDTSYTCWFRASEGFTGEAGWRLATPI